MTPSGTTNDDLIQTFTTTLEAAGGRATVIPALREVLSLVDPAVPAWISADALEAFPGLDAILNQGGVEARVADDPAVVRDAPLGITAARLAIAETGSVLLHENDLAGRAVSLMTQRLVVLCPPGALVPSLDEAAPVLREIAQTGPSYATFVTGPSRTADIERELAVGVQGPGVLDVVFVVEGT